MRNVIFGLVALLAVSNVASASSYCLKDERMSARIVDAVFSKHITQTFESKLKGQGFELGASAFKVGNIIRFNYVDNEIDVFTDQDFEIDLYMTDLSGVPSDTLTASFQLDQKKYLFSVKVVDEKVVLDAIGNLGKGSVCSVALQSEAGNRLSLRVTNSKTEVTVFDRLVIPNFNAQIVK